MRLHARAALRDKAVTSRVSAAQKNGEKRLRALLAKTKQWNSKTERERLAALMETRAAAAAPGSTTAASLLRLANALRVKRSVMLAKSHLLTCARAWGYASDVWFRHGRATRARLEREALAAPKQEVDDDAEPMAEEAAAGGEADVMPTDTELRLSGGGFPWRSGFNLSDLTVDQARCEVERQLKPLALAAAALIAGPDARLAAEQHGAYFTAADLDEVRYAAARVSGFAEAWAKLRVDTAVIAARAAASPHAAVPAWRRLAGRRTELEETLHTFGESLRMAAVANCPHGWFQSPEMIEQLRSGALQRLPLLELPESEHEVAPAAAASQGTDAASAARWLNEMFRGLLLVVELALRLQMLLRDAKFAPYSAYCEVSCFIIDTMAVSTAASAAAFTQRAAWMEEALAAAARASPSEDSPTTPQASSDGSAAANAAPAKPRMLLFRMSGTCNAGCGAGNVADDVSSMKLELQDEEEAQLN